MQVPFFRTVHDSQSQVKNVEICNLKLLTMASDDSYSSSETESELSFGAVNFDQIVQEADARRVSGRAAARKKRKTEMKRRAVLPQDLMAIALMDRHITRSLYRLDYEYNTSLWVVGAALCMQKGYLQKVQRIGKEKAKYVEKPWIRDTICNLFHIGHDAYSAIVGGYLRNRKVYQTGKEGGVRAGNPMAKEMRIPRTTAMQILVQDFARGRRMNRQRVTACQVLDFLVEEKHLIIPRDLLGRYEKLPFSTA
jgi:hypothetical protein